MRWEETIITMDRQNNRYDRPIKIAEGIFWVGFYEETSNLHCNPYLIVEGTGAVLVDGGSRPDFPAVMTKILQTGVDPQNIEALIYQHYDPDLCGSISNMIDICENPDIKILSERSNNLFINYYIEKAHHHLFRTIDMVDNAFTFQGRTVTFFATPYCHNEGSFVTYDNKTKILFSSDLFGSFSSKWDLFLMLTEECYTCPDYDNCPNGRDYCPLPDIVDFHRKIMPNGKALQYAMNVIKGIDVEMIAPQHGSILVGKKEIGFVTDVLASLDRVGIDAYV